jgi:hypothetical protein
MRGFATGCEIARLLVTKLVVEELGGGTRRHVRGRRAGCTRWFPADLVMTVAYSVLCILFM